MVTYLSRALSGVLNVGLWHQADHFRTAAVPSAFGGSADVVGAAIYSITVLA